jgi:hypothetical protein
MSTPATAQSGGPAAPVDAKEAERAQIDEFFDDADLPGKRIRARLRRLEGAVWVRPQARMTPLATHATIHRGRA